MDKAPKDTDALHALADLARRPEAHEETKTYLAAILAVQPDDSLAHASLGHLYFEQSTDDRQALYHFKEYLRLSPVADDREIIDEIVRNLEE